MRKRNWKAYRPISLQDAIEASIDFARERHNLSVQRIAELIGMPSHWLLYKWIESGAIPVRALPAFEHACGCSFVTQHLAASSRKLLIDIPTGRKREVADINEVQASCTAAVTALIGFSRGDVTSAEAIAAITTAMERLGQERAEVTAHSQPELDLG